MSLCLPSDAFLRHQSNLFFFFRLRPTTVVGRLGGGVVVDRQEELEEGLGQLARLVVFLGQHEATGGVVFGER